MRGLSQLRGVYQTAHVLEFRRGYVPLAAVPGNTMRVTRTRFSFVLSALLLAVLVVGGVHGPALCPRPTPVAALGKLHVQHQGLSVGNAEKAWYVGQSTAECRQQQSLAVACP
eukprot:13967449-Alexandrium_andersonii.AAC.1